MKYRIGIIMILWLLTACQQQEKKAARDSYTAKYIRIDSAMAGQGDAELRNLIAPYKHRLDSAMGGIIAYTPKAYFKKRPNGTLNNIACDMVLDVIQKRYQDSPFRPDFCMLNYGGLRSPLPKGAVTKSNIYQLMPFQNESVICRLSAKQMKELFDYIAHTGGEPLAGIRIYYKDKKFDHAIIGGQRYDKEKQYNVLTSDYTAKGGNHMDFFIQADTMIICGSLLRDDMFAYIESLPDSNLVANEEERVIFE
jgi:2',3'-cyclic-nucleotide 2'-phosphodiesterase (5'-nucleotidase family)